MTCPITDMQEFMSRFANRDDVVYITNPGNAGDNLIGQGTLQLMDTVGVRYQFGHCNSVYRNKTLLYAGGGNFVPMYTHFKHFLANNVASNQIVLLPHTIYGNESIIKSLPDSVVIVCREPVSYAHVHKLITNKRNVLLAHDMAFHVNLEKLEVVPIPPREEAEDRCKTLHAYRLDVEYNPSINPPKDNIDVSNLFCSGTDSIALLESVSKDLLDFVNMYDVVETNRLHVAIGAALLGKRVRFHNNSYYKCRAIYDFSLKDSYTNVRFIEDDAV